MATLNLRYNKIQLRRKLREAPLSPCSSLDRVRSTNCLAPVEICRVLTSG